MVQDGYCSSCGSLLDKQINYCPSCGKKNDQLREFSRKLSFKFNNLLLVVLIGSMILPILNFFFIAYIEKFYSTNLSYYDYGLIFSDQNVINFVITMILFIFLIVTSSFIQIKRTTRDYTSLIVELLIFSGIGSGIGLLCNNFILTPFFNSVHGNLPSNTTLTFIQFPISDLIIYLPVYVLTSGITFTLLTIFAFVLVKERKKSQNFSLSSEDLILLIVSGLIIGAVPILLGPLFIHYFVNQRSFILWISLYYLMNHILLFIVPLIMAIILSKINHISISKLPIYAIITYPFALVGGIVANVYNGTQTSLFTYYKTPVMDKLIFYILTNISGALTVVLSFFAWLFVIQMITSKTLFEETNQQYRNAKTIVSIKSLFKKRPADKKAVINIEPSLEKLESIIRENSEN